MESELVYLMEYGIKLWIEARVGGHPFIVFVLRTVLDKYYCTTVLDKFHILQCLSHCAEGSLDFCAEVICNCTGEGFSAMRK